MNWFYQPNQQGTEVSDSVGGYEPSQPSQKYPFNPVTPPRVDNKNQPWYGGPRWWGQGPGEAQHVDSVATQPDSGQSRYQLSDSWLFLNSWFGGATPKYNLTDKSGVGSPRAPTMIGEKPVKMGSDNL